MSADRWQRLDQMFTEAIDQAGPLRAEFVASACGADTGLREELSALLAASELTGDFLAAPALEVFAQQVAREGWSVKPGDRIGSYTVGRRLGAGGMGEVWRARDERLGRDVAIKLLLPQLSNAAERARALQDEARAAGALNHSNVLTVYDIGDHGGAPYLVTECLEGESLRARLARGALDIDAALDIALQVARGLGAAHERGIVHRDLKPENLFLGLDGRVKILDFGLATLHDPVPQAAAAPHAQDGGRSLVAGTPGYMAPEQVRGGLVDRRADVFALGVVLYEMLAGRQPFKGASTLATLSAALTIEPPSLMEARPEIPASLWQIVRRCLSKSPDERFATAIEVGSALEAVVRARHLTPLPWLLAFARRPATIVAALLVMLALGAGVWRWRVVVARVHWARTVAAPEAQRLHKHGDYPEAFLLARQALDVVPEDPQVRQAWLDVSIPAGLTSEPEGADVALAPYRNATSWLPLGRTPLKGIRFPRGLFRLRITKAGFQTIEGSGAPGALPRYRLDPVDAVPAGMVRVIGGHARVGFGLAAALEDFWVDRFEVTNRQFKEFVDQGGYSRRDYWREPLLEGARSVPWDEAVGRFRDATGAPGPATWKSGTYADGQADYPVGGVSWYEAAAYAEFAGKSLPTLYHWYQAAALGRFSDILTVSNFGGQGLAAVGSHHGVGPFGTYDMAGNAKEWCWTATDDRRFMLGGGWNEPQYMFADYDARRPFEREPNFGFRVAKYIRPLPEPVLAPVRIERLARDPSTLKPVSDEMFEVYRRQHAYDRSPLNVEVEATEETEVWVRHTLLLDAAYGDERMRVYLFLPKHGAPPYQTVVFFPAGDAFVLRSSRDMSLSLVDFVLRSGRALIYPVYKGTYERAIPDDKGPSADRDLQIAWARDLGRAIDYLETRSDIDRDRLAFYGVSAGAAAGVFLTALEPRLKVAVLQPAAISLRSDLAPEGDQVNYAPRIRMPTLLLGGRYDFEVPFETAQRPLFALLGAPAEHKRHRVFDTGHALPIDDVAGEILPWLDRYLGPVTPSSPGTMPPANGR